MNMKSCKRDEKHKYGGEVLGILFASRLRNVSREIRLRESTTVHSLLVRTDNYLRMHMNLRDLDAPYPPTEK